MALYWFSSNVFKNILKNVQEMLKNSKRLILKTIYFVKPVVEIEMARLKHYFLLKISQYTTKRKISLLRDVLINAQQINNLRCMKDESSNL